MVERVLLPLDGSSMAEAILPPVLGMLEGRDAELILLDTVHYVPTTDFEYGAVITEMVGAAERYVEELSKKLKAEKWRVRTVVEQGLPGHVILDVARREKVTMIAMGTHGRTGVARFLFGSVAEQVLRGATVPIFLMRTASGPVARVGTFSRTLVPIGAGELSLDVLEVVKDFVPKQSRVQLLHVEEKRSPPPWNAPAKAIEKAAKRLPGLNVQTIVRTGEPAKEIIAAARAEKVDLIAMTTHGRRGVRRWILGSVTERVLRESPVPMLIVRSAARS